MPIEKLSDLHGAASQKQVHILHIVWSINTCPTLTRWDLELVFYGSLSPECGPFNESNISNQFRVGDWGDTYFPILYLKIR
jgi:hypothetical protein